MPEIKIARTEVSTATDAAQWSADGHIGLVTGPCVVIFTPATSETDFLYDTTSTVPIDSLEGMTDPLPDDDFSVTGTTSELIITDIAWSPTGMSRHKGCILAALTSRGEALVFAPGSFPSKSKWSLHTNLSQLLARDVGFTDPRRLRLHSIAWSSAVTSDDKWGSSFIALGSESGHVSIYRVDSGPSLTYVNSWEVLPEWITSLKWSTESLGISESPGLLLSVGGSSNSLAVAQFSRDQQLDFAQSWSLLQGSRFSLYTVQWFTSSENDSILSVSRAGHLDVFIRRNRKPSWAHTGTHLLKSAQTAGIVVVESEPGSFGVSVVSCRGQVDSFSLESNTASLSSSEDASNPIAHFIARRHKQASALEGSTDSIDFHTYAAASHPRGSCVLIAYSPTPAGRLRYPILSEQSCRLAFVSLRGSAKPLLTQPTPVTVGSAASTWWEIKALVGSMPSDARQAQLDGLHSHLQELHTQQLATKSSNGGKESHKEDTLESALFRALFNPQMDTTRLLGRLGDDTALAIRLVIARTTLEWIKKSPTNVTDIGTAILQSYSKVVEKDAPWLVHTPSTRPITIPGGFFEEQFDFSMGDVDSIPSVSGHEWKRCSVTLLPLTAVQTLTCSGCSRKIIDASLLPQDPLLAAVLAGIDVCAFCGCRYYER